MGSSKTPVPSVIPSAMPARRPSMGDVESWRMFGPLTKCCGSQSEENPASLAVFIWASMLGMWRPSSLAVSHSRVTNRPIFMVDLAVPRDIEPTVADRIYGANLAKILHLGRSHAA